MMGREATIRAMTANYVHGAIDVEEFERQVAAILAPDWHPLKTVDDILKGIYVEQTARGQLASGRTAQLERKATSDG